MVRLLRRAVVIIKSDNALGIKISISNLVRATKVIE